MFIKYNFILNKFTTMLQNDLKLKEIIQKQFATAQLYPQPNEGLFIPSHYTLIFS